MSEADDIRGTDGPSELDLVYVDIRGTDGPSELDLVYDDLWRFQEALRRLVNLIDNDGLKTSEGERVLMQARQLLE